MFKLVSLLVLFVTPTIVSAQNCRNGNCRTSSARMVYSTPAPTYSYLTPVYSTPVSNCRSGNCNLSSAQYSTPTYSYSTPVSNQKTNISTVVETTEVETHAAPPTPPAVKSIVASENRYTASPVGAPFAIFTN